MGLCASKMTDEERRMKEQSQGIDKAQKKAGKIDDGLIKLLLLGAGESGKTTVLKQMEIIYGKGYDEKQKIVFWLPRIKQNIIVAMKTICNAVDDIGLNHLVEAKEQFEQFMSDETLDGMHPHDISMEEIGPIIEDLWNDPGIQKAWEMRSDYQVIESHVKYFERLAEISEPDYIPTSDDVLLCRSRTVGIVETHLLIGENEYHIYDVGGQRNERRKWMHCFDNVTAVLFVAALSEYDQVLFEDKDQNRMVEAIDLFHEHVGHTAFKNSSMILFLNKQDLFIEKLKVKPIKSVQQWEDYDGPEFDARQNHLNQEAIKEGSEYFWNKFRDCEGVVNRSRGPGVFMHVTCATDTTMMTTIIDGCKDTIVSLSLEESGFL